VGSKPNSVTLKGHDHFTGMLVTQHLLQPTRRRWTGSPWCLPIWSCSEWGLPCRSCHHECGELLPHHFTLTCKQAVSFLWHFPPITRCSRYEPFCPGEFGLSSPVEHRSDHAPTPKKCCS